ncbi:MAG: TfoX/Sxy family protein [Azoarcus sp.]|jgi:TfoX/Sxy family transcriptional regulator of competence genes|nr:TfoX/Sxy family protein [Azoarcus sp.]
MASTPDFIEYVCEQIAGTGEIRHKKMFGEYMIYVNNKPLLLVCDNTVYIKRWDCLAAEMKNAAVGTPYPGAKSHFILDIDDAALARKVINILEPMTPLPKPRKKTMKRAPADSGKNKNLPGLPASISVKDSTK